MPYISVIGIGSAFGDDRAGWCVAEALAASCEFACYRECVRVTISESPFMDLWEHLAATQVAIMVDAVRSGAAPGTVYRWDDISAWKNVVRPVSSHGLDLPTLLELAAVLGESPSTRILYGIETRPDSADVSSMTQASQFAVKRVTADILRDIAHYCAKKKSPRPSSV